VAQPLGRAYVDIEQMSAMNLQTGGLPRDVPFTSDPEVMGGRLVFRNTRIPVEVLFENLADGMSLDEILEAYPALQRADAVAAIALAAKRLPPNNA
jgi:uncharacterized protein (DUF433 family)